jgi:hypothetical protein
MQLSTFKTENSNKFSSIKDSSFYKKTEISFDNSTQIKNTNASSNVHHSDSLLSDFFTDDKRASTLHFFQTDLIAARSTM